MKVLIKVLLPYIELITHQYIPFLVIKLRVYVYGNTVNVVCKIKKTTTPLIVTD